MAAMDVGSGVGLCQWRKACRLCLLEDGIKLPIFEDEGKLRQVAHKIQTCFPIVIYEMDPLPKMICHKCLFKLETVFEFRLKCMDVNSALLKHLEPYGDNSDVQKYWVAVRESSKSQHSFIQLQGTKRRNTQEDNVSLPFEARTAIPQVVNSSKKPRLQRKQVGKFSAAPKHPKMTIHSEPTIGAHGARVTRSGNVSGDATVVFQEVFLDEASSDGFLPEQPNGDGVAQLQDVLAFDANSAAERKRKEGLEESPPILTEEMVKKEPRTLEENPSLQFQKTKTTPQSAAFKIPVNVLPVINSGCKDKGAATKLVRTKQFACETCDFMSLSRLELRKHLCTSRTSFKKCPRCKVDFKSLEALAIHQMVHFKVIAYTKEEELHLCDCGRKFVCKLMLASHRKMHKVLNGPHGLSTGGSISLQVESTS